MRSALAAVDQGARILTLTGAPGIGKSRVALQLLLAARSAADAPETWYVDASRCRDLAALLDVVCASVGLPSDAGADAADVGRAFAARGSVLVLLDGIDALAGMANEPLSAWTSAAPETCWVITSRQRLNVLGEVVVEVPPLASSPGSALDGMTDAARLLASTAARRGSPVAQADLPAIEAIGRELEGIPLALILAAVRLSVMGPAVLLHRLRANRSVLERSGRAAASKSASLQAAIDGSWNALLAHERDALAQCTTFVGSFDLAAAEAVVDLPPGSPAAIDVVQALLDKSMLYNKAGVTSGTVRLGMYRAVSAHAADKLSPDARAAAQRRHADYYVAVCEAEQDPARRRAIAVAEHDNLLAIVERILGQGPVSARQAEPALHALLLLAPGLVPSQPLHALLRSIDPIIDVTRDSGADPLLYARVIALRGSLRRTTDRPGSARDLVRALGMAQTLCSKSLEARCLVELGRALVDAGDRAQARAHFERALAIYRDSGELADEASCFESLALLELSEAHQAEAQSLLERAVALYGSLRDDLAAVRPMRMIGLLRLDLADREGAFAWLSRALAVADAFADRLERDRTLLALGLWHHDAPDVGQAARHYEQALCEARDLGAARDDARALGFLGIARCSAGRYGEAFALLRSASVLLGADDTEDLPLFLAYLAYLDRAAGRPTEAAPTLQRARTLASRSRLPWLSAVIDVFEPRSVAPANAADPAHVRLARATVSGPAPRVRALPDHALVVGPKAMWIRLPGAQTIDLERRRPLARIVERLAKERAAPNPRALPWDDLLEAGWPGERVLPAAGEHRVRVAVSTLRKLGLGTCLKTVEDGYELESSTPVVMLDGD